MNVKEALNLCKRRKGCPIEDDWELIEAAEVISGFLQQLVHRIREWEHNAFHQNSSYSMVKGAHDDLRDFLKAMKIIHEI